DAAPSSVPVVSLTFCPSASRLCYEISDLQRRRWLSSPASVVLQPSPTSRSSIVFPDLQSSRLHQRFWSGSVFYRVGKAPCHRATSSTPLWSLRPPSPSRPAAAIQPPSCHQRTSSQPSPQFCPLQASSQPSVCYSLQAVRLLQSPSRPFVSTTGRVIASTGFPSPVPPLPPA
ncbi:hypothetical protein PIB30_099271, partial [Stylosanthes scabra]|nr:hypothetical protein [Stylosanthes scabra]